MKEYVFVMSCLSLPHIVKIGFSKDCDRREEELSNSSTPFPFKLEKQWEVKNGRLMEAALHRHLGFCRIDSRCEFFGLPPQRAIKAIDNILKDGCFEREEVDEQLAYRITDTESLGKLIRSEREKQGLTQKDVALACGTGLRVIGEIEGGKETAQIGVIFRIIDGLRIKVFGINKMK
jgi:HTH-type transcriptional regulator/antitoxin HipB